MLSDIGLNIALNLTGVNEAEEALKSIDQKVKSLNGKTINIGMSSVSQHAKQTNNNFKSLVENAKKLGFALLTVRGIWFGIRKSMTMYLSQNEELQARLNGIYYAVGSLFAPALDLLVRIISTILWMINEILISVGLAGIKMKSFGKATGAAAKQMKQLLGFDEINNLTSKQGGGGGGGSKIKNPFEDILWAKFLKEHLWEILGIIAAIALAIKLWRKGTDLNGIIGWAVALYGAIQLFKDVIAYIKDPSWENFGRILKDIAIIVAGLVFAFEGLAAWPALIVAALVYLGGYIMEHWSEIWPWVQNVIQSAYIWLTGTVDSIVGGIKLGISTAATFLKENAILMKNSVVDAFTKMKDGILKAWEAVKTGLKNVFNGIMGFFERMLNNVINGINKFTSGLRGLGNEVLSALGFKMQFNPIGNVSLPRLATGTNYVPNDMVAMIHEGEAVVPKEFNPSAFYGTTSAEELNLLAQINEQLIELNRKNTDIVLDGESVAQKISNSIQNLEYRNGTRVFAIER